MQTMSASEIELVSGGDLMNDMAEGCEWGGLIGFVVGGPAGALEGCVDGAAAAALKDGVEALADWIGDSLEDLLH